MATPTRTRILDATGQLLRDHGYAGTGLKAISTSAAAPFGSLYHHFPLGKEELAAAALRHAAAGYAERVTAVLAAAGHDPVEAMRVAFRRAAETLAATDYADACPIATVALEVASSNDALRRVAAEIFEGWLAALDAWFMAAGIDPGTARSLSTLFLAALEGGFLLSRTARDTGPMHVLGEAVAGAVASALG
ncbi:MAG TPA: TetR/AcrR family transcriptional regulator [Acidimicrobiales bacterium]|nr:TetR/AcrR family transcriptional regulator [Acidimicrobiales bacterium]